VLLKRICEQIKYSNTTDSNLSVEDLSLLLLTIVKLQSYEL